MIKPLAILGTVAGIAWWACGVPRMIARERDTAALSRRINAGWTSEEESAVCFCGLVIYGRGASYWLDEECHIRCEDGRNHEPFRLPNFRDVAAVDRWLNRAPAARGGPKTLA